MIFPEGEGPADDYGCDNCGGTPGCQFILSDSCIVYSGPNVTAPALSTGMSLTEVIAALVAASGGGGSTYTADNGITVNGTVIRLGQTIGQAGNPAGFTAEREIPMNSFALSLKGTDFQYTLHHTPPNYGTTYVGSTGQAAGRFSQGWGTFNGVNSSDPRPNVVGLMWGYNVELGANPIIPGEASFRFGTETYYRQDGTTLMEFHLPEVASEAGVLSRIMSTYVHRNDNLAYQQNNINSVEYYSNQRETWPGAYLSWGWNNTGNVNLTMDATSGPGGSTANGGDNSNQPRFSINGPLGSSGIDLVGTDTTLRATYHLYLKSEFGGQLFTSGINYLNFIPVNASDNINILNQGTGDILIFGGGGNPIYFTANSLNTGQSGLDTSSWISTRYRNVTISGDATVADRDHTIYIYVAGVFQLLTANYFSGYAKLHNYVNLSEGVVTLTPEGAETIDGASTLDIPIQGRVTLQSDNANWISRAAGFNASTAFTPYVANLDQVLAAGGQLTDDYISDFNNRSWTIRTGRITFNNGPVDESGTEYFRFKSPHTGDGSNLDYIVFQDSLSVGVNPDGSYNQPFVTGFNPFGSQDVTQPGLHISMEPNYRPGPPGPGPRYMEYHQEITAPDGNGARLYSTTTIFTNDDQSIATSQTDIRASKFNFMDLQSHQLLEIEMQTGRLSTVWYKAPAIDAQSVYIGWDSTGADQFNISNYGGGTNELHFEGWSQLLFQGNTLFEGEPGYPQGFYDYAGKARLFAGDTIPAGSADDKYSLGAAGVRWHEAWINTLFPYMIRTIDVGPQSSPPDGLVWNDGGTLKMQVAGVTKTFAFL